MNASTTELFEPSLVVQLRARARGMTLDRALAAGADPSTSPLLAARAAQLVEPRTRRRIAARLEQFAFTTDRPRGRIQTLPLRGAVHPNRESLIALARTLSGERLARQLALAGQGLTGCTSQIAAH